MEYKETLEARLEQEKAALLTHYDDSSDEDESLDYSKVTRQKIEETAQELSNFQLLNSHEMYKIEQALENSDNQELKQQLEGLQQKNMELESNIEAAKAIISNNPTYVMEIAGRRLIYQHRSEYRRRKNEAFKKADLTFENALEYNKILVVALKNLGIITPAQENSWLQDQSTIAGLKGNEDIIKLMNLNSAVFFSEKNKFLLLRKLLRQKNRETINASLLHSVSEFVSLLLQERLPTPEGTVVLGELVHVPLKEEELKELVNEFATQLPRVNRSTLSKTRINLDLNSVEDFYAEELLRYRSLIRSSREIECESFETVQPLVFSSASDLVSQKKQTTSKDKRQSNFTGQHFPHRGTVKESVLNLGNYEDVLERLGIVGLPDEALAIIIRTVLVRGAKKAFDILKIHNMSGQRVSLSQEKKQIIVDTVELLFGTEAFRSPSAIVETNMILDLIIENPNKHSFKWAFTGKVFAETNTGNGGALSYTMKTTSQHSGGIPCGRHLSRNLDKVLGDDDSLKSHKYGGPFKVVKKDFDEYKKRKEEIAQSWIETCYPSGNKTIESAILHSTNTTWYKK